MQTNDRGAVHSVFVQELRVQFLQFVQGIVGQSQMSAVHDSLTVHHLVEFMQLRCGVRVLRKSTQVVLHLPEIEDVFRDIFFFTLHHQNQCRLSNYHS